MPDTATRRQRVLLLGLVTMACLGLPRPASAQEAEVGRPYRINDSGHARTLARDVAEYQAAGDPVRAAKALQELLDTPPARGLVIELDSDVLPRFEGIEQAGRRLFDGLDAATRAAWESEYRDDAESLLSRALERRRPDDLRAAARRYPARDVRRRAHEALAALAFARGDFAAATHDLNALLDVIDSDAERANVLARLAFARAQSGDAEGVERAALLGSNLADAPVRGPEGTEPFEIFVARMRSAAGVTEGAAIGRPSFGGNRHGTGLSPEPPRPDESPRWRVPTLFQEGNETQSDQMFGFSRRVTPGHRPVAPVVGRGIAYLNSGLTLRAVDISSGHVLWQRATQQRLAEWRDNLLAVSTAAISGDTVYAALASRADAPDMDRKFYERTIVYRLPHRSLAAYDARTGDVLWSHADEALVGHPDAAEITRESVASPPLVVGDDVLVSTWVYDSAFEVRLVCYDRRTGRTRWRRSIAQGQQELNLFGRPVKELATTPLAELDGHVFLATGLGVAAAVRLSDGAVEWITAYPQTPIPPSLYWYQTVERPVTWWTSPTAATRLGVVMAPTESPFLLSFHPTEGRLLWQVAHMRGSFDYDHFVGVSGRRVVTLGDRAAAFDLETGTPLWRGPDAGRLSEPSGAETSAFGNGVLTADVLYAPTDDSIIAISLADGSTIERWRLPDGGRRSGSGSLVSADGAVLVVNRDDVSAHYRADERHARLLARIQAAPADPRLRLEAGEILRTAGRLDEAIESLEAGTRLLDGLAQRARDRLEEPLRSALFQALIERVGEARRAGNLTAAVRDLERAIDVARAPEDAVRALFLLADTTEGDRASRALERIRDEFGDVQVVLSDEGRLAAGPFATLLLGGRLMARGNVEAAIDLWLDLLETRGDADLGRTDVRTAVSERLRLALVTHPEQAGPRVRVRARKAFEAARGARDADALALVARTYPDPQIRADAALLGSRLHLGRGQAREAIALLRGLLATPVEPQAEARAIYGLAEAYRLLGEVAAERVTLQRLARDHATAQIDGRPAAEVAAERLASAELSAPPSDVPSVAPPLALLWEADASGAIPGIVELVGRAPASLDGKLLATRARVLELLDAATGTPLWRTPTDLTWRLATTSGEAIVLIGDGVGAARSDVLVRAFRISDGAPLWTQRLEGGYRASARGLGVAYVVHARADRRGRAHNDLSAVDLSTGDVLASRTFDESLAPDIVIADEAVQVFRIRTEGGRAHHEAVTMDGATLALRGAVALRDVAAFDEVGAYAPGSGIVAALSDRRTLVGISVASGEVVWQHEVGDAEMRSFYAVTGGFIVVDTLSNVTRIDAASGAPAWALNVAGNDTIGWQGIAVADGLVVVTVVPPGGASDSTAVALDAATGDELWRARIALETGTTVSPNPVICRDVVAYEVNERLPKRTYNSRVVLLDRKDGTPLQTIAHPSIGQYFQQVIYDRGVLGLARPGELAVYGVPR